MEPPMVQSALHALPRPHRVSFEEFPAGRGFIFLTAWAASDLGSYVGDLGYGLKMPKEGLKV